MIVQPAKVLLPKVKEPHKFAVIACDQFSGQPEYWRKLEALVGDAPSALNLILPEAYLHSALKGAPERLAANMNAFLKSGAVQEIDGYILTERTQPDGRIRLGLIAAIDLAEYEYTPKNTARIKATERTDEDRLPPRVKIRERAPLEIPHIMVLFDDPRQSVLEKPYAKAKQNVCKACKSDCAGIKPLYDFELNMGGGHLRGWSVPQKEAEKITAGLTALERDGVLFVVGDGNHSLAAAKQCGHSRALVELVNIHSAALDFEPIHRIIFGAGEEFIKLLQKELKGSVPLKIYYGGKYSEARLSSNAADAIADIQNLTDKYLAGNKRASIEYVHGDNHLLTVADRDGAVAIFMPKIEKHGLFDYVSRRGVLPRKAFSMGHAEDKRYYFEMKLI